MSNEGDVTRMPGDQEYIFGPLITSTSSNDSTDDTKADHSVSAPIHTLCIHIREQVDEIHTASATLARLVDTSSAYSTLDWLNIRSRTNPIVFELLHTIGTFLSHVIKTFDNLAQATRILATPFCWSPRNADRSATRRTDFDTAIAAFECFPHEHAAARDMLPLVHDALRDSQQQLLDLLAFPSCNIYFMLYKKIIRRSCAPDYIQHRREALERLPVLLPSIGTSIDTIADRFDKFCDLFYAVAKSVTVQRIQEAEKSEKYREVIGRLSQLMYTTHSNIQQGRMVELHALLKDRKLTGWDHMHYPFP
ncbi:hypothetical protein FISHEDRAFT_70694 [Fistulina hepatica ATCC 64428]|uniref:Uncharacterized protein n=1 Tax=Fistulina hepatica ATCC 64428 TaxID=1128425 RepID=A0A0D7AJI1_9AGAR|nr:hypothetical protein FISHEDRAFT_70694 [Fistulina hepatica ATCC 64428]